MLSFFTVPPSWIKEPKDVNLRMGEEYSVECVADGLPKPNIKWISSSGKIIEGEVLDLGKIIGNEKQASQTLAFECVADNQVGDALRKSITISYNVPVKFEEKYTSLQVKRGELLTIRCNATGDTPISIKWSTKDGAKIDNLNDHRVEISEIPTSNGVLSELSIRSVSKTDGIIYKCDAENLHGRDERTIKVSVVEEPGAPQGLKINEVWSRSASISWRPPYNGNSPMLRYVVQFWRKTGAAHRLQEFNVSSSQTSTLIKNLSPGLSYEVCLVAENEVGRSEPSDTVQLYTGEEEPTGFPLDLAVEPLGPTTVRITWRAPPRETWNGILKGYYIGYRKAKDSDSTAYTLKSVETKQSDPAQIEAEQYEYFLRDLLKGTEYELVIKAYNLAGSGPQSNALLVRTREGDVPPPMYLTYYDPTANSVSLRWTQKDARELSSPITSYTIHFQREDEPKWREIPLSTLTTASPPVDGAFPVFTYVLQNLERGVQYRIFVTAINLFGFSDPSNIVSVQTVGERIKSSGGFVGLNDKMYNEYDAPYYMQPAFTIPILVAIVVIFVIIIAAYVCIRQIKARAAAAAATSLFVDAATMNRNLYATTRYTDFDKISGKPLILTEQGNIFPTPYATMPMDDQSWSQTKSRESHIYDAPT